MAGVKNPDHLPRGKLEAQLAAPGETHQHQQHAFPRSLSFHHGPSLGVGERQPGVGFVDDDHSQEGGKQALHQSLHGAEEVDAFLPAIARQGEIHASIGPAEQSVPGGVLQICIFRHGRGASVVPDADLLN